MKDENLFLDMLFETRSDLMDKNYVKERNKAYKIGKSELVQKKIIDKIENQVKDKNVVQEFQKLLLDYANGIIMETSFEGKYFYKLGFKDGFRFNNEILKRY